MVLECRAIAVCYQVPFMMISGRMLVKGVVSNHCNASALF